MITLYYLIEIFIKYENENYLMADRCENCFKSIKNHWDESSDGVVSFCSAKCREKWEKKHEDETISKDLIKSPDCNCLIEHKGTEPGESSIIFCDKIEYMHDRGKMGFSEIFDHHLMFWLGKKLVFKVYLPNSESDKEFKDIFEAMKSCEIKCDVKRR